MTTATITYDRSAGGWWLRCRQCGTDKLLLSVKADAEAIRKAHDDTRHSIPAGDFDIVVDIKPQEWTPASSLVASVPDLATRKDTR